ncbi:aquaporin AQPAn.G-like [Biomphalaria glabrata]|uniref:Aquaporin AQPAn.G-like n=1 Tax=Biomphalaria glabrata TaxID=6526 RepID=A0A9W2YAX7_BIOGL|nr:aquaporin AQPAn.G-like [Biomphalaria glabrata]
MTHHQHHQHHKKRNDDGSGDDLDELLWNNGDTVQSVSAINRVNYDNTDPFTIHRPQIEKRISVREVFPEPGTPDKKEEPVQAKPSQSRAPVVLNGDKIYKLDMNKFDGPLLLEKMTMTSDAGSIKRPDSSLTRFVKRFGWCLTFLNTEFDDITSISFWRACLAEFVGCLLLCFFAIGMGLHMPGTPEPPLLQNALGGGMFLGVLISALANVSGGHVNPAVTVGFAVLRQISLMRALCYIMFQSCGAITGSMLLRELVHPNMTGTLGVIAPPAGVGSSQALVVEMMISGFLVFVIIAHVDKGRTDVKGSIPIVVGLTIFANVLVGAPSSGGCMNPARAVGPAVVMGDFSHQWIYWLGPLIGGAIGALLYAKFFAVGANFKCLVHCCSPKKDTEYHSLLKKAPEKLHIQLEKTPETNV